MSKQILLVDDEDHMVRLLQFALKAVPARIAAVKRGEAALAFVQEHPVDLVILDYSMPGLDGVETLRRLRELPAGLSVSVVMLTARDQTAIRQEAAGLNVQAFLTKPFSPSDLARRASELLA